MKFRIIKMVTKISMLFLGLGVVSMSMSCNSVKSGQIEKEGKQIMDNTQVKLDIASVKSMEILSVDDERKASVSLEDQKKIAEIIKSAVYDIPWNDRGIAIKVVTPDYTLIITRKGSSQENKEWLMIWKGMSKIKYLEKWYQLPQDKMQEIQKILDVYQNKFQ